MKTTKQSFRILWPSPSFQSRDQKRSTLDEWLSGKRIYEDKRTRRVNVPPLSDNACLKQLVDTSYMCYEFMKYLTPKDLFSLMQSCRTFYEIIHQLKLLRPDAYNGLCICEERFEYYKISYLNLLYNYGQHLSHSELLFLSDSSLQHSCSQAMDLILGWLDISSPDICHILIKYDNRMSSGDVNQAMETFMRHPKIQELTSEVVEYLVSEQRFSLLENLPSVDFASFFQEILEVQPSFFATHPSILFQRWKQRKDRDLIVKHFTSIFRRMEENQELDELVLEMMNKKERQVQRKWVVESLSQEFQKSLLKRRSLVLEYGVDIMMFSLNISRHHMVICCLKVDPDLFSKELDLPRLSMELIDRCRYYLRRISQITQNESYFSSCIISKKLFAFYSPTSSSSWKKR
ncbi:hypothetical protein FDP41_007413 [Naegleria fowleri]|uniref:F-box domain-containing protein n=1 Tax=Naegleria fowleri TaxID=5763 RepID=A0A6A5C8Z6_NAEFO|nr:uncharacterized protein FDP41_007413 [Naegleria fowleri]KAF0984236.1 hypothetical protein FDP41_007413 [Naegleria fowleri]